LNCRTCSAHQREKPTWASRFLLWLRKVGALHCHAGNDDPLHATSSVLVSGAETLKQASVTPRCPLTPTVRKSIWKSPEKLPEKIGITCHERRTRGVLTIHGDLFIVKIQRISGMVTSGFQMKTVDNIRICYFYLRLVLVSGRIKKTPELI
jgi:hypothetical protein